MLKYSFNNEDAYKNIFKAVGAVLDEGYRTRDILSAGMTEVSTAKMGDLIAQRI